MATWRGLRCPPLLCSCPLAQNELRSLEAYPGKKINKKMSLKSSHWHSTIYISFLWAITLMDVPYKPLWKHCTACHLPLPIFHWPLTSILDHFNSPSILPLSDSTVIGQTLVSLVIWEEYIEELLWFSMASLCIVYWVCLIALCPNQRVQAGRAGVYRDALCCGLSQRAKNIHSTRGSEGEPIHSSVNTHKHKHSGSHTLVHRGPYGRA